MSRRAVVAAVAAAVMVVLVLLAARAGHDRSDTPQSKGSGQPGGAGSGAPTADGAGGPALRGLVGSGCADYAQTVPTGPGSITQMAGEPFATALRANPLLTTFDRALSGRLNANVDLVTELGSGPYTVFAPIDSAYAALPAATLQALGQSAPALRKALSSLVVRDQLPPSRVVGAHQTLAGSRLTVTSAAGALDVGAAHVVCGGLATRNVTIYLVDAPLLPKR